MTRTNASVLWDYFEKIDGTKKATCQLCYEVYSYIGSTANLKSHLRKKHLNAYVEVSFAQQQAKQSQNDSRNIDKEKVIYLLAASPTSSVIDSSSEPNPITKTPTAKTKSTKSRPFSERRKQISEHRGKSKDKRIIEYLTKEKINVAILQKELIKKEMEEKEIRLLMLEEEKEQKNQLYLQEMEHKNVMHELGKQEMVLKIELLKANLENIKRNSHVSTTVE